jgi:hypothetical protein
MTYKIFALPVTAGLSVLSVANNAAAQGLPVDTGTHWPIGCFSLAPSFWGAYLLTVSCETAAERALKSD